MTRLIKKYKNRRLYDTEISQYITIEDLQHYVVDGVSFKVQDSSTSDDITNAVLLQILVEMEEGSTRFLSSDVLRQLICLAHHPMNQPLKEMLEEMVAFMNKQLQSNPYLGEYQKTRDVWEQQMQSFFTQWKKFFE